MIDEKTALEAEVQRLRATVADYERVISSLLTETRSLELLVGELQKVT